MSNSTPDFPQNAFLILNGADIFPLEKKFTNIGRMDDNDIVLPGAHISRYHAQIRGQNGVFILIDLQSTSGTSVNGNSITSKPLAPGDIIMIAGVPLIYGQTGRVDRFKTDPEKPAMQPTSSKTELGATEEVDLSTLDNILDIMDFSKEDPDLPDDNTEI